jgi:high-affinity Fe2+/Pb2+ permease
MWALALGFLIGVIFSIALAVLLASGVVNRAVASFTLLEDETALLDEFAHLR